MKIVNCKLLSAALLAYSLATVVTMASPRSHSAYLPEVDLVDWSSDIKNPKRVRQVLGGFLNRSDVKVQTTSLQASKNPVTGDLIGRSAVYNFTFSEQWGSSTISNFLKDLIQAYKDDEAVSYNMIHVKPYGNDGAGFTQWRILTGQDDVSAVMFRTDQSEEALMIYVNNAKNRDFRDAYCISWHTYGNTLKGTVVVSTSLRPDVIERRKKAQELARDMTPAELDSYRKELTKDMTFSELSTALSKQYGIDIQAKQIYSDSSLDDLSKYRDQLQRAADNTRAKYLEYVGGKTRADKILAKDCQKQYKEYLKKIKQVDKSIEKLLKKKK